MARHMSDRGLHELRRIGKIIQGCAHAGTAFWPDLVSGLTYIHTNRITSVVDIAVPPLWAAFPNGSHITVRWQIPRFCIERQNVLLGYLYRRIQNEIVPETCDKFAKQIFTFLCQ